MNTLLRRNMVLMTDLQERPLSLAGFVQRKWEWNTACHLRCERSTRLGEEIFQPKRRTSEPLNDPWVEL